MWLTRFFRLTLSFSVIASVCQAQLFDRNLIGHRGGVVDSTHTENGLSALREAARRGYWMVELDMRLTKDSVLIAQHDKTLTRFYGQPGTVGQTRWQDMAGLVSNVDQNTPQTLERMLQECQEQNLQVMLDNKIEGLDTLLFARVVALLRQYKLQEKALMIGTDESTPYFTGKVKLSCTRQQLEENMKKPGYRAAHYFLFEGPKTLTQESVQWARRHGIMVVAAINKWAYQRVPDLMEVAKKDIRRLKSYGIQYVQIDSEFDPFFQR
ncbi:glycerophosphodiester phosphodiesterase [Larkinella insperata]|uniref:Glycerophosphodiester phosphodiesterase n=1 Tax=Larkinella insperata TaxID=332158 RepID=A0ABW3QHB5_9BACT|nr:glycerophosphodiester phosphodiesterase family protein [Larkinella insperata]